MKRTRSQITAQFNRAKRLGWIPHFYEAVDRFTDGYFDAADLMGIASRETELDPQWLTKAGDGGHGYGLMQADVRSFPKWIKSGKWQDAREGILKGAEVLMQKWTDVQSGIGRKRGVTSSKTGKTYYFTGKDVKGYEAQQVTIAAYNAGRWPHYAVSHGKHPDTYTTGKDYSSDVMQRAAVFRELLAKDRSVSAAAASLPEAVYPATRGTLSNQPGNDQAGSLGPVTTTQPPTQIAENIVNTGDRPVPDNFAAEQKSVSAPPKEGATRAAATMTIAGFVVPPVIAGLFKAIQDLVSNGYLNSKEVGDAVIGFMFANTKYVLVLVGLLIVLLMLEKAFKQVTLWIEMWIKSDPNRHDVEVNKQ